MFFFFLLTSFFSYAETFVVSVGIGNYADKKVKNLAKTEKDAKAISQLFKHATNNVATLTGKYATKKQILKYLQSQFSRAKSGDKIIFFFSGHGYPGGFCPHEMSRVEDGLTYNEVIKIMHQSKASSKFIFADACYSGAIRQNNRTDKPNVGNIVFFMSSRNNEYSIESPYLANGYFTKYLLKGLRGAADLNRDKKITASELFNYVSNGVKTQTHDKQHPVM